MGCFGAEGFETPNLDKMASEGIKLPISMWLRQFVSFPCGPANGLLSNRIGMLGAPGPKSRHGINPDEILIPEMSKKGLRDMECMENGIWDIIKNHYQPIMGLMIIMVYHIQMTCGHITGRSTSSS